MYVTDCLRLIVNNTAGQESRSIIKMSFSDIINPTSERVEGDNNKKAKEIIANIRNKLKGG